MDVKQVMGFEMDFDNLSVLCVGFEGEESCEKPNENKKDNYQKEFA